MRRYDLILFDLDGTLTDSKKGITLSVAYALDKMGIKNVNPTTLTKFIGPSLKKSFMTFYHMTDSEADLAIVHYRERFTEKGIFENELYQGIEPLLQTLKEKNKKLVVATSKPTVFANKILNYFQVAHYFDMIVGSELDGSRSEKSDVIGYVIQSFKHISKKEMVMVGDTKYDIEGANTHGIACIGVLYGYGTLEDLKGAVIVEDVPQLKAQLLLNDHHFSSC